MAIDKDASRLCEVNECPLIRLRPHSFGRITADWLGCLGPTPDLDTLLTESALISGVVHGVSEFGVRRLKKTLIQVPVSNHHENGQPSFPSFERKVRLIVTLYPTCPTTSGVLRELFQLQTDHRSLEVRIATCGLFSGPENTLACYKAPDSGVPTLLFGSSASFEDLSDARTHLTLVFFPEPVLAADWRKWFDVTWLNAAPLTEARTRIPELILPQGTDEAARQWMDYERLCVKDQSAEEAAHVAVDPITSEIKATAADGTSIPTVSTENKLPKVSPVYRKLAQLFEMGHLVSVDKSAYSCCPR